MNKKELFNEEREIPGRQKVVCRSNVPVLTPHAGLNPRSKHVLSLTASLAALRAGYKPERQVIKDLLTTKQPASPAAFCHTFLFATQK